MCLFRNQAETDTITDGLARFNQTVEYCASLEGLDLDRLWSCAVSNDGQGAELLLASHKAATKYQHPHWVLINGADFGPNIVLDGTNSTLRRICDAYKGKAPAGCEVLP